MYVIYKLAMSNLGGNVDRCVYLNAWYAACMFDGGSSTVLHPFPRKHPTAQIGSFVSRALRILSLKYDQRGRCSRYGADFVSERPTFDGFAVRMVR